VCGCVVMKYGGYSYFALLRVLLDSSLLLHAHASHKKVLLWAGIALRHALMLLLLRQQTMLK
jgi:hypothetical protein